MINLKKEIERLTKKQAKKIWKDYSDYQKNEFLRLTLSMHQPVIVFSEEFDKYKPNFNDILELKKDLDDKSKELVDLLLFRIYSPFRGAWYLNKEDFYTPEEIEMQNIPVVNDSQMGEIKYNPDYEKFKEYGLLESVYRYHNGLKLLPEEAISRIKGKNIIDGGAYVGDSALVFLDYKPSCIHAFEPSCNNYKNLLKNISDKKCESIIKPQKFGLAEKKMTVSAFGEEMGFKVSDEITDETIECISIDSYVEENKLDVGLIKLDIEGFELEAIKGAVETIKSSKPILLISIYHTPKDFFKIKPYLESLNLGYKFEIKKLLNNYLNAEIVLMCY